MLECDARSLSDQETLKQAIKPQVSKLFFPKGEALKQQDSRKKAPQCPPPDQSSETARRPAARNFPGRRRVREGRQHHPGAAGVEGTGGHHRGGPPQPGPWGQPPGTASLGLRPPLLYIYIYIHVYIWYSVASPPPPPPPMVMGQPSTPPPVVVVLWLGCGGLGLV